MGGQGSGRKPLNQEVRRFQLNQPIVQGYNIPNHSGISTHPEFKEAIGDYVLKIGDTIIGDGKLNFRNADTYIQSNVSSELVIAGGDLLTLNGGEVHITGAGGFTTSGFVKNNTSGKLTGGSSIDISTDTNLAATSPIVLTGDTLSFDFSTSNTWTGTNKFTTTTNFTTNTGVTYGDSQGLSGDVHTESDGTDFIMKKGAGAGSTFGEFRVEDGNLHIEEDSIFDSEVKGTKELIVFTHDVGFTVSGGGTAQYIKLGEVLTTTTKGFQTNRAGSITGLSINFDVTAKTGFADLKLQARKNGNAVFSDSLNTTITTDKTDVTTQARGIDTFAQGDTLSISFTNSISFTSITIDKIIVSLEVMYDA